MYKKLFFCLFLCPAFFLICHHTQAQLQVDFESGVVFSGYNDVRVPGDQGTFISLTDDLETLPRVFYRLRLSYLYREKHFFSALFAPLTLKTEGDFGKDLIFQNTTFAAGTALNGGYQFNSYRLTYRYNFPRTRRFQLGIGATAKIRDARITLESEDQSATKTNVGFVPLINFMAEWIVKERLSLVLTGDALVAPQGRAEDVLLAVLVYPNRRITLKIGYRVLEGGADNDEVYNFTLLHYAVIGGILRF